MIEMLKKQLELLRILVALKREKQGSATAIQKAAKIGNYYAAKTLLDYLKSKGLVEEDYDRGPPAKYIYFLTEKGNKAAELAEELLKLLGEE